jgi:YD repeat-containing protein
VLAVPGALQGASSVPRPARTDVGEPEYTVTSVYDLAGNRLSVVCASGRNLTSVYDPMNRLTDVNDGADVTHYAYDANGNRTSKAFHHGGTEVTEYVYDTSNRLATASVIPGTPTAIGLAKGTGDSR